MLITANQIHNGLSFLPAGCTINVDEDGTIREIMSSPTPDTVHYEGIIVPGFVNTHCHLELSHTRGLIPEHTGLINFLKKVSLHRNDFTPEQKESARLAAHQELIDNGIVAVGDIANTTDTLPLRGLDKLHFHTFVESLGFTEANAARSFGYAQNTYEAFAAQPKKNKILAQSIAPHAPYSVSSALFKAIDTFQQDSLLSIHNQESIAENDFFESKKGGVLDLLTALGIDYGLFAPSGKTSLQSYIEWLTYKRPFIFVHNTFSEQADVQLVKDRIQQAYWCLCPNANLYIENKLPDIDMLMAEGVTLCIGTDSLASNHQLCVLAELQTIKQHYPHMSWETLLRWGTSNGAIALQMQDTIGTITPGKKPGLMHLSHLNSTAKLSIKPIIPC